MTLFIFIAVVIIFLMGPRPKVSLKWNPQASRLKAQKPLETTTTADLKKLRQRIVEQELSFPAIPDGAEKHIQFSSESRPKRTPYCVLYIHGFSATRQEISPVPETIAKTIHANYYATRLTGHGLDGPALANAKAADWLFDMVEAWDTAQQLGEKVIIISTSTGGTLTTWLAQQPDVKHALAGLILVSPNFQPKHWATPLFLWPWSNYWLPLIGNGTHGWEPSSELGAKYWTYRYPVKAIHHLAALVRSVRKSRVENISCPSLFIYSYYDRIVNARMTDGIFRRWGADVKHHIAIPFRADDNNHVVTGDIVRPENTEQMSHEILNFLKENVVKKNG